MRHQTDSILEHPATLDIDWYSQAARVTVVWNAEKGVDVDAGDGTISWVMLSWCLFLEKCDRDRIGE